MDFAGKVWKLLVGVKDALVLAFMLLFFLALYAVLTARPHAGAVHEGALLLKLDGAIVEEPAIADPFEELLSSEAPLREYRARDVVRALRAAAGDDQIKAVALDLSRFTGGGLVNLREVGAALDAVRAAKKPVLTYGTLYTDDAMLLAAHASEVWVDSLGGAIVTGPGGGHLYYGRLLEKLKVTANVFRVGAYKSAVEPFIRNDQSPESREASRALYAALWEAWKADVAKARPQADFARATTDPAGWLKASGGDAAKAAKASGLVDRIGNPVMFGARVAEIVGADNADSGPGAFAHTGLHAYLAAHKPPSPGKPIGVVTVAGEIVDGEAGPGTAGGDRIAALLDEALDKDFAALVVRVDSPGGSIVASERIREAIERHKAKGIPVVVSMANLAASGGYWVSTPATRIFAEPATITGSIGVFAMVPSFERAMADLGVTTDGVRTTPLSGQPDLVGGLSPEVSAMIQANVESNYARFLALVGKARGKTAQQVDAVAQGRVWDGGTARQLGLVDRFGGLDDALAEAAKAAGIKDDEWHAVYLGEDSDSFASLLQRMRREDGETARAGGGDLAALVGARQQALIDEALAGALRVAALRGVQARCLECPPLPGRRAAPAHGGALALLARALGFRAD